MYKLEFHPFSYIQTLVEVGFPETEFGDRLIFETKV